MAALDAAYQHRRHQAWAPVGDHAFAGAGQLDENFEQVEQRAIIAELLDELPERDRRIVSLRFYEGLTQAAIGRQLGMSQMQVSRLLARIPTVYVTEPSDTPTPPR